MTLALAQNHDQLIGTLAVFRPPDSVSVSGSINVSGLRALSGSLQGDGETDDISGWSSQFTDRSMTGRFTMTRRFTNFFGPQVLIVQAEFIDVMKH